MTGELISSGLTLDAGRQVLNTVFSASTSTLNTSGITFQGILVNSLSGTSITATTIYSGGTNLSTLLSSAVDLTNYSGSSISLASQSTLTLETNDPGATELKLDSHGGGLLLQSSNGGAVDLKALGGGDLSLTVDNLGGVIHVNGLVNSLSATTFHSGSTKFESLFLVKDLPRVTGNLYTPVISADTYYSGSTNLGTLITNLSSAISGSSSNIFIGDNSGLSLSSSNHNLFAAHNRNITVSSSNDNTFIGANSGITINNTAFRNVLVGFNDGNLISNAFEHAFLFGVNTGLTLTNGSKNAYLIGNSKNSTITDGSNGLFGLGTFQNSTLSSSINDVAFVGFISGSTFQQSADRSVIIGNSTSDTVTSGSREAIMFGNMSGNTIQENSFRNTLIGNNYRNNFSASSQNNFIIGNNTNNLFAFSGDYATHNLIIGNNDSIRFFGAYNNIVFGSITGLTFNTGVTNTIVLQKINNTIVDSDIVYANKVKIGNSISATTFYSGTTELSSLFAPAGSVGSTFTGGTVAGATYFSDNLSATTVQVNTLLGSNLGGSPAWEIVNLSASTTNATAGALQHGDQTKDRTYSYDLLVTARQVGGGSGTIGDSKSWKVQLLIQTNASLNSTLIGSATTTSIANSSGASTWGITAGAFGGFPGPALNISVTGQTSKTITWAAHGICTTIF